MAYFNGKILTSEDVREGSQCIPSKHQVSCKVYLYLGNNVRVPAVVVGVKIKACHAIYYDLAFRIADTDYFSVATDVRGFVYSEEEIPSEDGGLVSTSDLKDTVEKHKPTFQYLSLVPPSK